MYSLFDLKSVAKELSRQLRVELSITCINNSDNIDIELIKTVTKNLDNDVCISVSSLDDDITGGKKVFVGDKLILPYDKPNKEEVINIAKIKLENLRNQRQVVTSNNVKVKELAANGIIEGALVECTIKNILPLGDMEVTCNNIPSEVQVILPRTKTITEVYSIGTTFYATIFRIQVIGEKVVVSVSRKSKQLISELLYDATKDSRWPVPEIKVVERINGNGSMVMVNGPCKAFIGKGAEIINSVREKAGGETIRLVSWDPLLPNRVFNCIPESTVIQDVFYPQETGLKEWLIVANREEWKYVTRKNAELIRFIKAISGVSIRLVEANEVDFNGFPKYTHTDVQYDGSLLSQYPESVRRYYYLKFAELGIKGDMDLYEKFNSIKLPSSDMEVIIGEYNTLYTITCPDCGAVCGIENDSCPECGTQLR